MQDKWKYFICIDRKWIKIKRDRQKYRKKGRKTDKWKDIYVHILVLYMYIYCMNKWIERQIGIDLLLY